MSRAPFQVLLIPYRNSADGSLEYCLLKRTDMGIWQFVAGGGETGETYHETAKRELVEETGSYGEGELIKLDTIFSVPVSAISDRIHWLPDIYVIPCYCFGINLYNAVVQISTEHSAFCWLPYTQAAEQLHFDNNRTALWELNERLQRE